MTIENVSDNSHYSRYECIDTHGRIIDAGSKETAMLAFENDNSARYVVQTINGLCVGAPLAERVPERSYYRAPSSCS